MVKRLFIIVVISIFAFSSYSFSQQDNQAELAAQQEELNELSKKIADLKEKIRQVKFEYVESEKQLQGEVAEKTCTMRGTEKEQEAKNEILCKAREKQADLRKDYYCKKKPLTEGMNKLKIAHGQCRHKIKKLEREIRRVKEGKGSDHEYTQQMEVLRQELAELKQGLNKALAKLQNETEEKLAALINKEHRAKAHKQILSEAKDEELRLRREYAKKKEIIVVKMDKAKAAHRERMKQGRALKRKEQLVQGKGSACNFGPASSKGTPSRTGKGQVTE